MLFITRNQLAVTERGRISKVKGPQQKIVRRRKFSFSFSPFSLSLSHYLLHKNGDFTMTDASVDAPATAFLGELQSPIICRIRTRTHLYKTSPSFSDLNESPPFTKLHTPYFSLSLSTTLSLFIHVLLVAFTFSCRLLLESRFHGFSSAGICSRILGDACEQSWRRHTPRLRSEALSAWPVFQPRRRASRLCCWTRCHACRDPGG
jgi:hypothetical protein